MVDSFEEGSAAFIASSLNPGPKSVNKRCWLKESYSIIGNTGAIR